MGGLRTPSPFMKATLVEAIALAAFTLRGPVPATLDLSGSVSLWPGSFCQPCPASPGSVMFCRPVGGQRADRPTERRSVRPILCEAPAAEGRNGFLG